MARRVKAPLIMPDGAVVRDPDELKLHFDLPTVLEYYENGKLAEWLDNCLYTEEATKVRELVHSSTSDLGPMLCDILGVVYTKPDGGEEASGRRKRLAWLRQYTADESILAAVDHVVFSQEELVKLLEKEPDIEEIYLCGEWFVIPTNRKRITYIGVNQPQVYSMWGSNGTVKQVEKFDRDEFELGQLWRSLAEQGYAIAQNQLGRCYGNGEGGVDFNLEESFKWYKKAAEQGYTDAEYTVACCYRDGYGVTKDQERAIQLLLKIAEQGKPGNDYAAKYDLTHWFNFLSAAVDKEESFKWFLKAAEQGHAIAQNQLGCCYRDGESVDINPEEAFKWYKKAAEQGYAEAKYNMACCYRNGYGVTKDQDEAFKWFLEAAEQGDKNAQNQLGCCYRDGESVDINPEEAFKWYKKAAEQGQAEAKYNMACCYRDGYGVTKDQDEAFKWFLKAVGANADVQDNLVLYFRNRDGVAKDEEEAFKWYKKAAEQGSVMTLGSIFGAEDNEKMFKGFLKAAEQGDALAQYEVAMCYELGRGVAEDREEAFKWYKKAAEQGHVDAQYMLQFL